MTVDVSTIYLRDVATGESVEAELCDAIEQAQLDDWQTKWQPALLAVLQELARKGPAHLAVAAKLALELGAEDGSGAGPVGLSWVQHCRSGRDARLGAGQPDEGEPRDQPGRQATGLP
jgi:hypothetical protein